GIKGTLLAPNASVNFNNGHIDGSLIVGSITGTGESHNFLFEGSITGCDSNECAEVYTRIWTATDNCGNSTSITQTITIVDTTPPVITCPHDLTVECIEDIPAPNVQLVIASDDCSDVIITWEGDTSDSD